VENLHVNRSGTGNFIVKRYYEEKIFSLLSIGVYLCQKKGNFMTVVVGLAFDGHVYISADSALSDGRSVYSCLSPKVGVQDDWAYGYAGTLGVAQLMKYVDLPKELPPDPDIIERAIRLDVCHMIKSASESFGGDTEDHDTSWLLGTQEYLYEMSAGDWGVSRVDFAAIGLGAEYALGALYSLGITKDTPFTIDHSINAPRGGHSAGHSDRHNEINSLNIHHVLNRAVSSAIHYSPECEQPIRTVYI